MNSNEFPNLDYTDTTFCRCGKRECYITCLWCKNRLSIDPGRKSERIRLKYTHLMVKAKEIGAYSFISNMYTLSGWKSFFLSSASLCWVHIYLPAKWNKSGLLGAVSDLRKSEDHPKKAKGHFWNSAMHKETVVLLSQLKVEEEVNFTKN